jgi:putative endonuclease
MDSMNEEFCVYIMTNRYDTVLYTGVTSDLKKRVWDHKTGMGSKFASKYRTTKLVYFEVTSSIKSAILGEKEIKGGSRQKKIDLIQHMNPGWDDLSENL